MHCSGCLTLDLMHVDYKVVVMILVGCVQAIACATGMAITPWQLSKLINYPPPDPVPC
jgi:hypothetical protein